MWSGAEPRPQSHFGALPLHARKNASGCRLAAFSGSLVSIAMSGKMNCQFRLRSNLVFAGNLRHINIIVVQTGKLIFVRSEDRNCGPLNFAALFGRTPRTCLRPALNTLDCDQSNYSSRTVFPTYLLNLVKQEMAPFDPPTPKTPT